MLIYEIKNILVDGKPVNGFVLQAADSTNYFPAEDGTVVELLFTEMDNDKPAVHIQHEYEMKRNDTDEKADDVKLFAYQGKVQKDEETTYEGLVFKAVMSQSDCRPAQEDESVVVVAEKENGEYLDSPQLMEFGVTESDEDDGGLEPLEP